MDTINPVDELLFGLHATIERHGWMAMSVFGDSRQPQLRRAPRRSRRGPK